MWVSVRAIRAHKARGALLCPRGAWSPSFPNVVRGVRDGLAIVQERVRLLMVPGSGIWTDIRARARWYKQDWKDGLAYGFRCALCELASVHNIQALTLPDDTSRLAAYSVPLHMCFSCQQSPCWPSESRCSGKLVSARTRKRNPSVSPQLHSGDHGMGADGVLTAVQTLASTGVAGVVQVTEMLVSQHCFCHRHWRWLASSASAACASARVVSLQALIGGQPLLITDVSEPITITYGYMYTFARNKQGLGTNNFLAWAGWSCVWAGIMLILVAVFNGCNYINRFTRFTGELFGCLVAILFVQQFVQGTVSEFREQDTVGEIKCAPKTWSEPFLHARDSMQRSCRMRQAAPGCKCAMIHSDLP